MFIKKFLFLFFAIASVLSYSQTASFTTSTAGGCSPLAVSFDASSSTGTGTINYIWDFGNGNTSSGTDKVITSAIYTIDGNYTITLQVIDNNGTSSAFTQQITVFSKPKADFSIDQANKGCTPYAINFEDNSSPISAALQTWTWDFGDGNISNEQNPSHTYTNTGKYDLTLIVTDANGCQGDTSISNFIELFSPFALDFETSPNNASRLTCLPSIDISYSPIMDTTDANYTYLWNFGDGTSSTSYAPSKTYSKPGNFDVTLEATNLTTQCIVSTKKNKYVEIEDVNPFFTQSTNSGCVGLNVDFENKSNVLKNGQTVTWYFGDGDSLQGNATDGAIQFPSHTYTSISTFIPSIKINTNNGECIETFTSATPIQTSLPPTIDFNVDSTNSCKTPSEFIFTSTSNTAQNYLWDFGDGTSSTAENPAKPYSAFGTYDVQLTVTDSLDCSADISKTDYILIEAPQAAFTSDIFTNAFRPDLFSQDINLITGGCIPLDIEFTDLSVSPTPIVSREWNFGDGNTLTGNDSTPTNTYTTEGKYQTTLQITTIDGCTASFICDSCAKAGNQPLAEIDTSMYPLQMCCDVDHTFLSLTDTTTVDFIWYELSTGATQGYEISQLLLTTNWTYQDQLPIENTTGLPIDLDYYVFNKGCVDSVNYETWTTLYQPYVEPVIYIDPCIYDSLFVIDSIYINSNIDSIYWDFPYQGQFSNDIYPTFIAPDTVNTLSISVTAFDLTHKYKLVNGDSLCSCIIDQQLYFPGKDYPIDFEVDTIYGCIPLNIAFDGKDGYAGYDWSFGDGKSGSGELVTSTYDTTGNFEVQLITTDNAGCFDTVTKPQFIESIGPEPNTNLSELFGCLPFNFSLIDMGKYDAPIIDRFWTTQLGDTIYNDSIANFLIDSILSLPYVQKNGLDITLTVTDTNNCTNSSIAKAYIGNPIPDFNFTQSPACGGDSLALYSIESDTTGFAPFTYKWLFEDGSTATGDSINKYLIKGNHNIDLLLTDSLGCTDTSATKVAIINYPELRADFYADETIATCPPFVVQFKDTSQAGRSPITSWNWNLGDASPRSVQDPAIIYSDTGNVDITLIITDSLECTDTIIKKDFIKITGVTGSFDIDNRAVCNSDKVIFTASSPNGAFYTWDLGDGGFGEGDTLEYSYSLSGTRYPTLVIQDSSRLCSFTHTDTVRILPTPTVELGANKKLCAGNELIFSVEANGLDVIWSTGSTNDSVIISTSQQLSVFVNDPDNGCNNADTVQITYTALPIPSIPATIDGCMGETIELNVSADKEITHYSWSSDGTVFSTDSIHQLLLDFETKNISIEITDTDGCKNDSTTIVSTANLPPTNQLQFDLCKGQRLDLSIDDLDDPEISDNYAWYRDTVLIDSSEQISFTKDDDITFIYTTEFCVVSIETAIRYHEYPIPQTHEIVYFCQEDEGYTSITPGEYDFYYWPSTGDSSASLDVSEQTFTKVMIGNEWKCFTPDSIQTVNLCGPQVFVANAFSPNNDDLNDFFDIKGRATGVFNLTIFDRWGEIIYYTEQIEKSWDGFYNDKEIPEGTYPYLIRYSGLAPLYDKEYVELEGRVTVIR